MEQTISPWLIYWVMQADTIIGTMEFLSFMGGALVVLLLAAALLSEGELWPSVKRPIKISLPITILFVVIVSFMPPTKTLVTVFSVPTLIQAANSLELDETAKKSISAVNKLLDAYIEDTPAPQSIEE